MSLKACVNMTNIDTTKKIISLHIKGKSLREIEAETSVSKDTANGIITEWRQGKIQYLQEGIPLETRMIEASRFMDKNHIDLQEALSMSNDLVILEACGVDRGQIFSLLTMLKGLKPDELATFTKTAITLNQNGIKYSDLESRARELEAKNKQLEDGINLNNATLKIQEGKIQANSNKMMQQQNDMEFESKKLNEIRNNRYMDGLTLAKSQWINGAMEKMKVDPKKIKNFFKEAIDFNYSAADLQDAKLVWDALPKTINRSAAVVELKHALEVIKNSGWDITSSMELARKLHNISGSKEKVLDMVTDLDLSLTNVKKEIERVKKEIEHAKEQNRELASETLSLMLQRNELIVQKENVMQQIIINEEKNRNLIASSEEMKIELSEMEGYIKAGNAILYLFTSEKKEEIDLSLFSQAQNVITEDEYKKLKIYLWNLVLKQFKNELAIIEFDSRSTFRIVDGDEYERALATMTKADIINIRFAEATKIKDEYANDIRSLISDIMDGKKNIKGISTSLRKEVNNTILKSIETKLSEVINSSRYMIRSGKLPIMTEQDGKIVYPMVSLDSLASALVKHLDMVEGNLIDNKSPVKIPMCKALMFLARASLDEDFEEEKRKQFRMSLDKAEISYNIEKIKKDNIKLTSGPNFHEDKRIK